MNEADLDRLELDLNMAEFAASGWLVSSQSSSKHRSSISNMPLCFDSNSIVLSET